MPEDDAIKSFPQPQNPTDFDYHYRALALPPLERLAAFLAAAVAHGSLDYEAALDQLCRSALRLGAVHLTDFAGLEEHLSQRLADAAAREAEQQEVPP